MTTETKILKLSKPEATDFYDISVQNENMDKIDEAMVGKADKTDIPSIPGSLPANGGNADTVGGKLPSDFANASHNHTASQITGLPTSLPANGGNADTVGGKHASDFANSSHNHTASQVTGLPTSLPANGGNSDTVDGWHVNLAIGDWGIKPICAGTGDMVAGATGLLQGQVYIVYE